MSLLITTKFEETWKNCYKLYFLGDWCKIYLKKYMVRKNSLTQEYYWDNRERLHRDFDYLNNFYEKSLFDLSIHLNQIHNLNKSERYWRILVGPWLSSFIMTLYDCWLSIESANENFNLSTIIGIKDDCHFLIPNDMNEFNRFIVCDGLLRQEKNPNFHLH